MIKVMLGLAVILMVVAGYFRWRLRRDQRNLIDYLSNYYKNMTSQQIKSSRHFIMQSDYWRRPQLQRGHRLALIGKIIAVASAILVGLELLGLFSTALTAQLWFTESLGGVVLGLGLNLYGHWHFNRTLATLTAETAGQAVTLTTTPHDLGQIAIKHHVAMRLAWLAVVVLGLFASATNLWPVGALRYQAADLVITEFVHQLKTTKPRPETSDERVRNDRKAVQALATSSTTGLTANQTVSLLSVYYEAASQQYLWQMKNGVKATYTYYVLKQKAAKAYVIRRQTDTDETRYVYYASVTPKGTVTLYQFDDPDAERTAFNGRLPKPKLMADSTVELGQLVTAYQHQRVYRVMQKILHAGGDLPAK